MIATARMLLQVRPALVQPAMGCPTGRYFLMPPRGRHRRSILPVRSGSSSSSSSSGIIYERQVTNADAVLDDIDKILRVKKPPSVEYLFVAPRAEIRVRLLALLGGPSESYANPYGHSAVRYTLPGGEQKVGSFQGAALPTPRSTPP